MALREQISILVNLQTIDSDIRKTEKRLGKVDSELAALDLELENYEVSLNEKIALVEGQQKLYRSLESDANMNFSKIASSKAKLPSVKTNKEYQSFLKEIEDLKKSNSNREDQMLDLLDQIDEADALVTEKKHELTSVKKRVSSEKADVVSDAKENRSRLDELQKDFSKILGSVDPGIMKTFSSVRDRIGNLAIAKVDNAVCAGCHMNIPPQMYIELQRFETLMYCPQCQRIIYSGNL